MKRKLSGLEYKNFLELNKSLQDAKVPTENRYAMNIYGESVQVTDENGKPMRRLVHGPNIEERIAINVGVVFRAAKEGRDETVRSCQDLEKLIKDVVEYITPTPNPNAYEKGELVATHDGKLDASQAARWAAGDYNRAIEEMKARAADLCLYEPELDTQTHD